MLNIDGVLVAAAAAHFMDFLDNGSLAHIPNSVLVAMAFLADLGLGIGEEGVVQITPEDIRQNEAFAAAFLLGSRGGVA